MKTLPPTYYLDHFRQVLHGVHARCPALLEAAEHRFMGRLHGLTEPGLGLYARLVNRKGPWFRRSKLSYPELGPLEQVLDELEEAQLLAVCRDTASLLLEDAPHAERSLERLLACYAHRELQEALGPCLPHRFPRKELLCGWLARWEGRRDWLDGQLARDPVIRLAADDPWPWFRFLFFGELTPNLSGLAVRELGHIVTETPPSAQWSASFASRREAEDCYRLARFYETFRQVRDVESAVACYRWWQGQRILREELSPKAQPVFDRFCERLGRLLEREKEMTLALALYAHSPVAPLRERRARLLLKTGRREEALKLCQEMLAEPCHAEEAYAARQMLDRLERRSRRSQARSRLNEADLLLVDYAEGQVEEATLTHYRREGWAGIHSENWLWNGLFGLLLWDIVYDGAYGGFHQPLQMAPADLHEPDFYRRRADAIESRLALLSDPAASLALLRRHYDTKAGLANPFVGWHASLLPLLEVLVTQLPAAGLAAVLRHMAQDMKRRRRGFPDLFLWRAGEYRFVEVKSPNDQLSPQQFHWLDFFERHGLAVAVQRVTRPLPALQTS